MFENFMAFDTNCIETDFNGDCIYLVIFNDNGYGDAIKWLAYDEASYELSAKESSYYEWIDGVYKPLYGVDDIPQELINCFNEHRDNKNTNISSTPKMEAASIVGVELNTKNTNTSSTPKLYTVKLHLSDGTIIKPNYQSDDMLDFTSIIEQLLTDELFNGQVEKIVID